jgi:hypothetical protein
MATINLTNQALALTKAQTFKAQARTQLLARKPFLDKLSPAQLKKLYQSGKDPVLNELYDIYKGLDGFFSELLEG